MKISTWNLKVKNLNFQWHELSQPSQHAFFTYGELSFPYSMDPVDPDQPTSSNPCTHFGFHFHLKIQIWWDSTQPICPYCNLRFLYSMDSNQPTIELSRHSVLISASIFICLLLSVLSPKWISCNWFQFPLCVSGCWNVAISIHVHQPPKHLKKWGRRRLLLQLGWFFG